LKLNGFPEKMQTSLIIQKMSQTGDDSIFARGRLLLCEKAAENVISC